MRRTLVVVTILVAALLPQRVLAHTQTELDLWLVDWTARVLVYDLTADLLFEYRDMAERHPPPPPPPIVKLSPPPIPLTSWTVEQWRSLVALYFPPENVDAALRVMSCESVGNPWADNPLSSASGLFQHLDNLWPPRALAAGWGGASIWDPAANVAVAAWLSKGGTDWSDWLASRHCHGL